MEIVQIKVSELIPYVNNTRTHSDEQVQQIASSIKEFGFTNPVLLDEKNGVIAGHGRIMGAKLLQLDEVPTITLTGLTDAQIKAYIIADNKLALNAGWDEELLKVEIEGLYAEGFDITMLGFTDEEIKNESDLWEVKKDHAYIHPTQKPVELMERGIFNCSTTKQIIMDLFLGSGSTLIASENLTRRCYGMELDEKYAQVIIQRYIDYTSIDTIKINGKEVSWSTYKEENS